ncbi:uncharacterized protein LOC141630682 [Silene latifolia]|uniref:uncharacterized protein LOC141630682 n=1 Tax=Silene latifolia TaxID=37657 RepID=UPI003D78937B
MTQVQTSKGSKWSNMCLRDKTDIYFNGVRSEIVKDIIQISGFRIGKLPFKYLGVPISSKKITKYEGQKLIERIVIRIRALGARHLSYAGRLILVQSVLATMHSYWASFFLLHAGILKKVDSICRNFLWGGRDSYLRAPNVNWDKCCTPKEEGGGCLGLKNASQWNRALLGKYTDWLATKKDHLCVKWVNHVYKKGCDWKDYSAPTDCIWFWKKIIHIKDKFKQGYVNELWLNQTIPYSVAAGYQWLRTKNAKVSWRFLYWNSLNVPRHSFIYWASQHCKLLTLDRMIKMGRGTATICYICGVEPETHEHLFYKCEYSKICMKLLQDYLHLSFLAEDMVKWFSTGRGRSGLQRVFTGACFVGVIYAIWNARNRARIYHRLAAPWILVK